MAAAPENDYALKFKTPEERRKLCSDYIAHIESGLSDECFPDCDPQTIRSYLDRFPEDFDTDKIEVSKRRRQLFWERMGRDGAMGQIDGFNAKSWSFNMQNRFNWREKKESDVNLGKRDAILRLGAAMLDDAEDDQIPIAGE